MDLWVNLENIIRNLDEIKYRNSKLSPREIVVNRLGDIQASIFSNGITPSDIDFINNVATELDIVTDLRKTDFLTNSCMMGVLRVDGIIDSIKIKLEKL